MCVFVTGRSLVCEWHGDGGQDPFLIWPVCFIDYSYTHTLDVQVQDFLCNCVIFFTFLIKSDSVIPCCVPVLTGHWEGMMQAPPPWAEIPLLPHILGGPRMVGGSKNCSTPQCGAWSCDSGRAESAPELPRCTIAHSYRDVSGALANRRRVWYRGETECVCQPTQAVPSSTCALEPAFAPMSAITAACN